MALALDVVNLTVNDQIKNVTSVFEREKNQFYCKNRGGIPWKNGEVSKYNPKYSCKNK